MSVLTARCVFVSSDGLMSFISGEILGDPDDEFLKACSHGKF